MKSPLLLERLIQPVEQTIKGLGEMAELILGICHLETLVQVVRSNAPGLCAHLDHRRQAPARQKIAATARQHDRQWNGQRESRENTFQKLLLAMKRLQNEQPAFGPSNNKVSRETAVHLVLHPNLPKWANLAGTPIQDVCQHCRHCARWTDRHNLTIGSKR